MNCKAGTTMRRLGDYIRQVDVRNRDLEITNLKGLSIEKIFIESIANTIGTDLRGYKVVKPRQFAYVPVTSRNGEKITVALYDGENDCIISQAYTAFEIIDEAALLPEYLMMWFRRPEFDRYARFHSHGSAREIFDWEEMCDVLLPVPPIEEQREIVSRHKAIEHKIDVNRRLIAKLEETARTIYRHTFVENIDPENLPTGWRMGKLDEICDISAGGDCPEVFSEYAIPGINTPIFSNALENDGLYGYTDKPKILHECVTVSARGTIGFVCFRDEPFVPIVRLLCFTANSTIANSNLYLYHLLNNTKLEGDGAVQLQLTAPKVKTTEIIIPEESSICEFTNKIKHIQGLIKALKLENNQINRMGL